MHEKTITVRIEPELERRIERVALERTQTKSDLVREALIEYLRKKTEMKEIKKIVAKKFALGKISFEELIKIVGYEEARKIAFYVQTAKKSLMEGLE